MLTLQGFSASYPCQFMVYQAFTDLWVRLKLGLGSIDNALFCLLLRLDSRPLRLSVFIQTSAR
jgi:hypothetical protein